MKLIPCRDILILGIFAIYQVYQVYCSCQEIHYSVSGTIVSLNDPDNKGYYPINTSCSYTITTRVGRETYGNRVTLEFEHFDLESSTNCTKDVLVIEENGVVVQKRCGSDKMRYVSTTGTIKLIFRSDATGIGTGFRIRYRACGGYYSEVFRFDLISTNYGIEQYPNDTNCRNYIDSIDDYGFRLVFNEFSLEDSQGCINDKFLIYKGYSTASSDLLGIRCGKNRTEIISESKALTTTFVSNSQISDKGFNVSVYACSRLLTTYSGYVSSPKFPSKCEPGALCIYEIRHNAGSKLKIEFQNFVQFGNDYLTIKNGSMSSNATTHNITNVADIERLEYGNVVFLEFSCDVRRSDHYHGFQMFFYDNKGASINRRSKVVATTAHVVTHTSDLSSLRTSIDPNSSISVTEAILPSKRIVVSSTRKDASATETNPWVSRPPTATHSNVMLYLNTTNIYPRTSTNLVHTFSTSIKPKGTSTHTTSLQVAKYTTSLSIVRSAIDPKNSSISSTNTNFYSKAISMKSYSKIAASSTKTVSSATLLSSMVFMPQTASHSSIMFHLNS